MPLRLEIKRKFSARSDRVKSVDIHPKEPWILASLYNGNVYIWNYKTEQLVKSFEVTELPVRCSKFIARKQWMVTAADDMFIRVYNYNTMEKIKTFEAHTDYIRSLAVHPVQPYVLSSSDDMLIKLWDWNKGWQCVQVFEGHSHYAMMVAFNPKDPNTFASASLDRTIKIWGLGSPVPHFTLEGHERGVNCIDYFNGGDKPYLVSGSDDRTVKVWDYQNKTCVQTLEGHSHNVSVVCFHPTLPVIISGSEDTTVRIWNANTYRLEKTLNYSMDRVWAIGYQKSSNKLALGYDDGSVLIKLGSEEPAVTMDGSGKVVWAKHSEIQQINVKTISGDVADGERLVLPTKELGTSEVFPQTLRHNSNGRFVVVCGEGEYIIYTALAWRNKSFGQGLEFVWGLETGEYAVRESTSKVKLFKDFKEVNVLRPSYSAEGIHGGPMLAVRSGSFVVFYLWNDARPVRKIDVTPKAIYWSDNGDLVTIACETSFYILKYNAEVVARAFEASEIPDEGIEDAFEVVQEFGERVRTGLWIGDCFIYTNATNRLNYCVGSEIVTISHLDRTMYLLGYIQKQSRLFLADKSLNLISYGLEESILSYQTAVLRGDTDAAAKVLPRIPKEHRNRIAQFLEAQGHKEAAMEVATDPDLKFELAVQLGRLNTAYEIAKESDSEAKWKQLSDMATAACEFDLAEECLVNAQDLSGLLLFYSAFGHANGLVRLSTLALESGRHNIAFICFFLLGRLEDALSLLVNTGRVSEAAFLARTYKPSQVSEMVKLWRADLSVVNEKAANSLADPAEYDNLFPDFELALKAERLFHTSSRRSARTYPTMADNIQRNLIEEAANAKDSDSASAISSPSPAAPASPSPSPSPVAAAPASPSPSPAATVSASPSPAASPSPSPASPSVPRSPAAASPPVVDDADDDLNGDVDVDDVAAHETATDDAAVDAKPSSIVDDEVNEILNKSIDELLDGVDDE